MKKRKILGKCRKVGAQRPSRAVFKRFAAGCQLVRRLPKIHQTPEQLADRTWHCPTCHKTLGQLLAEGKIVTVQGNRQCADCGADIDNASETPRRITKKDWHKTVASFHRSVSG